MGRVGLEIQVGDVPCSLPTWCRLTPMAFKEGVGDRIRDYMCAVVYSPANA